MSLNIRRNRLFLATALVALQLAAPLAFAIEAGETDAAPADRDAKAGGTSKRDQFAAKLDNIGVSLPEAQTVAKLYDRGNLAELKKLINEVAASSDIDAHAAVKALIKLRSRGLGESFDVTPTALRKILASPDWTPTAKANFAAVLTKAVEISEAANAKGTPLTNQQAFEEALGTKLDAYKKGCKEAGI